MRELVDVHYPLAEKIILVNDNFNTHKIASLYKAFPPAEALRIAERIEMHYTPKAQFAFCMPIPILGVVGLESEKSSRNQKTTMDHPQFQDWLSDIDFSPHQKMAAKSVLSGETRRSRRWLIEARLAEPISVRTGAHIDGFKGLARGLRRYPMQGLQEDLNAATGTAIQGLHNKGRCLTFAECLTDG